VADRCESAYGKILNAAVVSMTAIRPERISAHGPLRQHNKMPES